MFHPAEPSLQPCACPPRWRTPSSLSSCATVETVIYPQVMLGVLNMQLCRKNGVMAKHRGGMKHDDGMMHG